MEINERIQECYKGAVNYPDLAKRLNSIGIESYTVDVSSGIILYRLAAGETFLNSGHITERTVSPGFDKEKTVEAVRNNQQGRTDYPGFMEEIAAAGVRFYEATLNGANKRVTYIGAGGYYEEAIPW